jgi:Dolichyl-phosphate-mannose-protein mannosyltransferase
MHLLILTLTGTVFTLTSMNTIPSHRFSYDEADYVFAASKGLYANYVDQHSISFLTFLENGVAAVRGLNSRIALSEFIRQSQDTPFYRHYHGPLYFYWLRFSALLGGDSEYRLRLATLALHVVSFAAIYLGCVIVFKNEILPAMVSSFLLLLSPSNIKTASQITPHAMYVLTVIVSLFAIARLLQTRNLKYLSFTTVSLCFAVIAIEYALLLLLTCVFCLFLNRENLFAGCSRSQIIGILLKQGLIFITILVVFWPGGLIKLTVLKNYLFFSYFTLFRGDSYGTRGFLELWWWRVTESPFEYVVLLSLLLVFTPTLLKTKKCHEILPFVVYSLLILATTLGNRSTNPKYVSSLLPPLYVVAGLAASHIIAREKPRARRIFGLMILLIALTNTYFFYFRENAQTVHRSTILNEVVSFIDDNGLQDKKILVPISLRPTINYYYPATFLGSYVSTSDPDAILTRLASERYNGLFYSGMNTALEDSLSRIGAQAQVVTSATVRRPRILYYRLGIQ